MYTFNQRLEWEQQLDQLEDIREENPNDITVGDSEVQDEHYYIEGESGSDNNEWMIYLADDLPF